MHKHYDNDIRNGDHRVDESERAGGPMVSGPQRTRTAEDLDYASVWGNKIGFQILDQNENAAIDLVRQGIAERRRELAMAPMLDTSLAVVGVDERTCNMLEKYAGVVTVGQLLEQDIAQLRLVPELAEVRLVWIFASLTKFAIHKTLAMEEKLSVGA